MKRLLPRPPRRRADRPQEGTEEAPQTAEVPPTEVQPAVPAGAEPADPVAPRPTFRNRGRLRRRLRFLRRVRELGFRDLGGLVFDQHKFHRPNPDLVRRKVTALAAVDAEVRALEHALGERRAITELREPGISACPRCGTLHGSDARFCPACGLALVGPRTIATDVGEGVHGDPPPEEPRALEPPRPAPPPPSAAPAPETAEGGDGGDPPTVVARPGADHQEP